MSAYNMSRTKYIKESSYYENSAFAFASGPVTDLAKDIRNKEREEKKIMKKRADDLVRQCHDKGNPTCGFPLFKLVQRA